MFPVYSAWWNPQYEKNGWLKTVSAPYSARERSVKRTVNIKSLKTSVHLRYSVSKLKIWGIINRVWHVCQSDSHSGSRVMGNKHRVSVQWVTTQSELWSSTQQFCEQTDCSYLGFAHHYFVSNIITGFVLLRLSVALCVTTKTWSLPLFPCECKQMLVWQL